MAINFESALGIHDKALALHSRRAEILANNITNADTPGYKARDIDFKAILNSQVEETVRLATTRKGHIGSGSLGMADGDLYYRTPSQPSLDGNTVEMQKEQAEYAKNALRFQSSFIFLNGKIRGLSKAIKGE